MTGIKFETAPQGTLIAYREDGSDDIGRCGFFWLGGHKSDMEGSKAEALASLARETRSLALFSGRATLHVFEGRDVQDLELAPPERSGADGTFEEQGHPQFSWSVRYTEEEPRYRSATTKNKVDLRPIRHATVKVYHDDGRRKRWAPVTVDVHLMPLERWSYQSKFFNELFREEGGRRR